MRIELQVGPGVAAFLAPPGSLHAAHMPVCSQPTLRFAVRSSGSMKFKAACENTTKTPQKHQAAFPRFSGCQPRFPAERDDRLGLKYQHCTSHRGSRSTAICHANRPCPPSSCCPQYFKNVVVSKKRSQQSRHSQLRHRPLRTTTKVHAGMAQDRDQSSSVTVACPVY